MKFQPAKVLKGCLILLLTPFLIFLLAAALLYCPPVQRWAVDKACAWAEAETGYRVGIGQVRLAFPIDLVLADLTARDAEGDTLLDCKALKLSIPIRPLFDKRVDVDGFLLSKAQLNTKSLISDTHVEGTVGRLEVDAHGYRWAANHIDGLRATLSDADVLVVLSDTAQKDTTPSAPWLIELDRADIRRSRARVVLPGDTVSTALTIREATARGGLFNTGEPRYTLTNLSLEADCARYAAYSLPDLNLQLDSLSYAADCLTAAAKLRTGQSSFEAGLTMPLSALKAGVTEQFTAWIDGQLQPDDLNRLSAQFLTRRQRREYLSLLPQAPVKLYAAASGSLDNIRLRDFRLGVPTLLQAQASGTLADITESSRRGTLHIGLTTAAGLNRVVSHFAGDAVRIPAATAVNGHVTFLGTDSFTADLQMRSAGGTAHVKGETKLSAEEYKLSADLLKLSAGQFLPGLKVSPLTARLSASGHGFNPLKKGAVCQAKAAVKSFTYDVYPLDASRLEASVKGGLASLRFDMNNRMLQGDGRVDCDLNDGYRAALDVCIAEFNPHTVGLSADTLSVGTTLQATLQATPDLHSISSAGHIDDICFISADTLVQARDLIYDLATAPDTTFARVQSGDLSLSLHANEGYQSLIKQAQDFASTLVEQLRKRDIDQTKLASLLPTLRLNMQAGHENPLAALLAMKGYRLRDLDLQLNADSARGLAGWARTGEFDLGRLRLDTLYANLSQDTTGLRLRLCAENYKKTNPNRFTATADGYVLAAGAGAELVFKDEKGDTGINLGLEANVEEQDLRIHLFPANPIIAYRRFTLNPDNYILLGRDSTLRADIDLLADDGTGLKVYGEPNAEGNNDLTVSVNRLNLGELSTVLLWLPPMKGYLSGDVHLTKDDDVLSAMATLETQDFAYDGVELGHLSSEIIYLPKEGGEHYAEAYLSYDNAEVLQARGSYFQKDEGSFVGDIHLNQMPLNLANAFLTGTGLNLAGTVEGDFHAEGPLSAPVANGSIQFVDAHAQMPLYAVDFKMDDKPVEIHDSRLTFDDFALRTASTAPLTINGTVNAADLSDIQLGLRLNASDFELINTPRNKESLVFGKLYADFSATMRGNLNDISVKGNLHILDRTNATYILRDSPVSVRDEFADLVTFTNFQDTTHVEQKAAQGTAVDVNLGLSIDEAAKFHCLLAEDGSSYVDVMGGGNLNFRYTRQGKMLLTGRYTIEDGEMKYEMPVIPLRTFKITQGSYVEFTGDLLNPTLSIAATENTRASVSTDGAQRSVRFTAGVNISQTLSNMGLEFTLEAPEDATIQNELAAMTPLQRNKTAVALMATGMYVTDDLSSLATGFKGSNALNMFLQSSIQSIAGNALKTVDVNFDVGSNTTASGGTTTDYSFQFAKRFWGDRIAVILGGKVSTGADASNTAASIIDNISVEYRLDKGATRYIRLFYDRSAHDALEGTLMETGAGLVLRRKTNKLGELFLFKNAK